MSSNKRGSAADELYRNHLQGSRFANNPPNNRQAILERMYQRILTELAMNRFKWSGFPDTVDTRFLEKTEFYHAVCIFYKDEQFGYLALKGGGAGSLNMIDDPVSFRVVGNGFVGKELSAKECVPIWANYLRMPDLDIVMTYSKTLAEMHRTVEINSANARRNRAIITSEDQKLSKVNINRQIDEGLNLIQIGGAVQDMAFVQAVDMGVNPDTIVNMHIVKTRIWNECMGLLGIENANQDKKERLVAAEVDANDEQTNLMRNVNLNARREACDKINKMFPDLTVSVEYRTDADKRAQAESEQSDDSDGTEVE